MKKILLLFLALTAGFLPLAAQDWAPFKIGHTPYFQAGDSIYSLRLANVQVVGGDSVFEFNPIIIPDYVNSTYPFFGSGTRSHDNIFGYKMLKNGIGEYRFAFTSADTFLIIPDASVGQSWSVSQSLQLTATMLYKVAGTVNNLPDSIATIRISNGDSIKVSKRFGLIKSKQFQSYFSSAPSASTLSLVRLPEAGMGTMLHHPYKIFDFQPGDKFLYEGLYKNGFPPCYNYYKTVEVISVEQFPSITYTLRQQILKIGVPGWPCTVPNGSELSDFDTITFMVHPNLFPPLHDLSSEYAPKPYNFPTINFPNFGQFVSQYNNRLGTHFEFMALTDSVTGTYTPIIDGQGYNQYAEGLGLIKTESDLGGHETLIAYQKGNETYGNWQPLVLSREEELAEDPVQVYPNPFTTELMIKLPQPTSAEVIIYNLQGQKIRVLQTNGEANLMLPDLPAGLYLLRVKQGEKSYSVKVQKQ